MMELWPTWGRLIIFRSHAKAGLNSLLDCHPQWDFGLFSLVSVLNDLKEESKYFFNSATVNELVNVLNLLFKLIYSRTQMLFHELGCLVKKKFFMF